MILSPALKPLTLLIASGVFSASAFSQWQWIDKDGHKVFSDRSPPAEIQDKNILKRPAGNFKSVVPAADSGLANDAALKPPTAKASAPKLSGKDTELEARKKKAEDEEAAKKKLDEDKVEKAKAENCDRAKTTLATLQSGVRVSSVNAKGEREVFDDTKRASETKRAQDTMAATCK